ncbi:MAG: 4-alpha-glucanotransferase [Ferruginibacter sp.]
MRFSFFVQYSSVYGQSVALEFSMPLKNGYSTLELLYLDANTWHAVTEIHKKDLDEKFPIKIIIKEKGKADITGKQFFFNKDYSEFENANIHLDWYNFRPDEAIFESKAFKVLGAHKKNKAKHLSLSKASHLFNVQAPELPAHLCMCICGNTRDLGDWEEQLPLLMQYRKKSWRVKLRLKEEDTAIVYKYAVYDFRLKKIVQFETGDNRLLPSFDKEKINFLYQNARLESSWKTTGLNIQLSALKTINSWGVGDFSDLVSMVDWASASGINILQLLPINDTTATYTYKDAYPYAAVSAFALHPVFLNVHKLIKAKGILLPKTLLQEIKKINSLPVLDYESALQCKMQVIELLFEKEQYNFKDDMAWFDFLELNRYWLVPYAAFCFLRDKYKTADSNKWETHSNYDEAEIQELVSPGSDHYAKIAIHYFIQFHLHLQLKDAVDYAHKKHIAIKGDLPIGVHRCSVETWVYPHLFHMHTQAGAPPDAFTEKGQNWSFPTYNWANMEAEGFSWWRQRMEQLSNYFDAIRIDHVLGFFRIWSIPADATEGILGKFVPAAAVPVAAFEQAGIPFDEDLLANPFINNEVLKNHFDEEAGWIKINCMDDGRLNKKCRTQKAATDFFENHPGKKYLLPPLLSLISDVILLMDENVKENFHFRINMQRTEAFKQLPGAQQQALGKLYNDYFYHNQDLLWKEEGIKKLKLLAASSDMFICAEDLGMVPEMVPPVLNSLHMAGLVVQRMPQKLDERFADIKHTSYLTVVTPSTHDMSPLRLWWKEDRDATQYFYNYILGHYGEAPLEAEAWICKEIIEQHLQSPSIMAVFLLQDLLAIDENLRRLNPAEERINNPAFADHNWNYRMHLNIEDLIANKDFSTRIKNMFAENGR